mmetsp:Transcript_18178/g.61833  ORF Transcript_18178/g.61833 Transcript_18178/m.61833 type:complete len:325 (-) Transcript_18178:691-1665(-)
MDSVVSLFSAVLVKCVQTYPEQLKYVLLSQGRYVRCRCLLRNGSIYQALYDAYGPAIGWEKRYHLWYQQACFWDTYPIRSTLCPLSFDPEDKILQKALAAYLKIPTVETISNIPNINELSQICEEHTSCVVKPAIGGMSAGVMCISDGLDTNTGCPPDFMSLRKSIQEYAAGKCAKNKWWIVEKLCTDEIGCHPLRDFKVFMNGGNVLAVQIMSDVVYAKTGSWPPYTYVSATVDEDYKLITPWNSVENPFVRSMVSSEDNLTKKPACWKEILKFAKVYGEFLGIFCRIDFFATSEGEKFCEIETLMNCRMLSKEVGRQLKHLW